MNKLKITTAALAAAVAAAVSLAAAPIQAAPAAKTGHSMKAAAQTVYVCKDCKEYYSASSAKKMGYKDGMGHTLTKVSKTPAGYMNGDTAKM